VAIFNGIKNTSSGTAISASPNPNADLMNVAEKIIIKMYNVLISISNSWVVVVQF